MPRALPGGESAGASRWRLRNLSEKLAMSKDGEQGLNRDQSSMRHYVRLVLGAGGCAVASGMALIVSQLQYGLFELFVIPAIVFSLLVPIGGGIGFGALGVAAGRGGRAAFYASWILAALLVIPVAMIAFVVGQEVVTGLLEFGLPQEPHRMSMTWATAGLAALALCLGFLIATVAVGFQVRSGRRPASEG